MIEEDDGNTDMRSDYKGRSLKEQGEADPDIKTIIDGEIRAGYKIEIFFGPDRSSSKDFYAIISLFESGKFFHGGGDANAFLCLDCRTLSPDSAVPMLVSILDKKTESDKFGCGYPIINAAMGGGMALCPHCQRMLNTDNITGQIPFHGTTQQLAKFVSRYFDVLKHNADIYCKYAPTDLRYEAMKQAKGLEVARRLRGLFIYPLKNILRDVSSGASIEGRLRAFFNA